MTDWRDDEADEAEFDKGFYRFIMERKIKTYKKGDPKPLPDDDLLEIDDQN